jgi:hypothetical protein
VHTHNPKTCFLSSLLVADRTPPPRVLGSIFFKLKLSDLFTCNNLYSLVVCVYKNEVITYFSNYQEIDKQNGKGFIIDLFVQESRLI